MSSARPVSSGARFIAASLAAIWAMLGLAKSYGIVLAAGSNVTVVIAIAVNAFLVVSAALAFVSGKHWRGLMLIAMLVVTVDRVYNAVATGAPAPAVTATIVIAVVVFAGVSALVLASSPGRSTLAQGARESRRP